MTDKKNHIRITKCYLVEVIDDDEKEIKSDFFFGSKEEAIKFAEKLKEQA